MQLRPSPRGSVFFRDWRRPDVARCSKALVAGLLLRVLVRMSAFPFFPSPAGTGRGPGPGSGALGPETVVVAAVAVAAAAVADGSVTGGGPETGSGPGGSDRAVFTVRLLESCSRLTKPVRNGNFF